MASPIKSQGTIVRVSTAEGSNIAITSISAANPAVVTTAAPHGLSNNQIVTLSGVAGALSVNDRAFVVRGVTSTTFQLGGVDGTQFEAAGTGGVARAQTMTAIDRVTDFTAFAGESAEFEVSHLGSTAVERESGLTDQGEASFSIQHVIADPGQQRLLQLFERQIEAAFAFYDSGGRIGTVTAKVRSFPVTGSVNTVNTGAVALTVTKVGKYFV